METRTNTSLNIDRCPADSSLANRKLSTSQCVTERDSDINKSLSVYLFWHFLNRQTRTEATSSRTFAPSAKMPSPKMICKLNSYCLAHAQLTFVRCYETDENTNRCSTKRLFEHSGKVHGNRPGRPAMTTVALFIFLLALSVAQSRSGSDGQCGGVACANGGTLITDSNDRGKCTCQCRPGFVGPFCQYGLIYNSRKRSDALDRIRYRLVPGNRFTPSLGKRTSTGGSPRQWVLLGLQVVVPLGRWWSIKDPTWISHCMTYFAGRCSLVTSENNGYCKIVEGSSLCWLQLFCPETLLDTLN